jgi:hypothetical protein
MGEDSGEAKEGVMLYLWDLGWLRIPTDVSQSF